MADYAVRVGLYASDEFFLFIEILSALDRAFITYVHEKNTPQK
jgi:hypothetical protein